MLAIQNVSFYYGDRALYDDASLHIKPKDRIGLIGQNGTGKSTLLKMISGDLTPESGDISMPKDCTVGFLNQDLLSFQSDDSILRVAMQAFEKQLALQEKIERILKKMETEYEDKLVEELTKAQEQFETLEGYSIQSKAESILEGLGFSTEELQRPLRTFSGGWRMRVMLAKLLLMRPSLLMLDEPTNHLDLPSIQWLENYLTSYEGAIILVSHDRFFLDRTTNKIVEVSGGKLNLYAGNFSFYEQEKELRNEVQANAYKNQQQQIKQTERFIERFRSKATKARQVQSKAKMLDKMDKVEQVVDDTVTMDVDFRFSQQPGKIITTFNNMAKAYGDNVIFEDATGVIERGDKIAFIGANGKGKSTLLRVIYGSEPYEGEVKPGHNVITSFYAQHQLEALGIENEVLTEMKQSGSDWSEQELRSLLGTFLFQGEEVFKKIKILSGGEKSRVALAKTLISQANFLLLDEPTNHLDMQSVNVLAEALHKYKGTYIVVSHDRHFISRIAEKIWYIEDGVLKEYPGTYDEYIKWQEERTAKEQAIAQQQKNNGSAGKKRSSPKKEAKKTTPQRSREEQKAYSRELSKAKKAVSGAEMKVSEMEKETERLEAEMAKTAVYTDPYALAEATQAYEKAKKELDQWTEQWERAMLKLEELQKDG